MIPADVEGGLSILQGILLSGLPEQRHRRVRGQGQGETVGVRFFPQHHRHPGLRHFPVHQCQQEQGVAGGIFCCCRDHKRQLTLRRAGALGIVGQLRQPHQIPRHQGITAGHGAVIGFLGAKDQRLDVSRAEIIAAVHLVFEPFFDCLAQALPVFDIFRM